MAQLYFYYSAMNAGKSTNLLQSAYNYRERGMEVSLYTAAIDDRFGVGKISSRIGLAADANLFDSKTDFWVEIHSQLETSKVDCILMDEAQFLSRSQVKQLARIADQLNIPVLCYGLRSDFLGEPFEGSKYLLTWADKLSEIKTVCHCGRKATMVLRVDESGQAVKDGEQIEIGGDSRYVSVCRKHYYSEISE
ncbi:thymidine kinase [Flocculibacter collagenilyticus]|uniref:thymidine kinase n=1 Tax=Flocculibacter collagenilyticus TaxID=2744479 RepID=UPI0018F3071D|nr:thymidine kinase [Flocculibacter collagenilyticus]